MCGDSGRDDGEEVGMNTNDSSIASALFGKQPDRLILVNPSSGPPSTVAEFAALYGRVCEDRLRIQKAKYCGKIGRQREEIARLLRVQSENWKKMKAMRKERDELLRIIEGLECKL